MSLQTLPLYDIISVWRDTLKNSGDIRDWCMSKYSRRPKIYVGIDRKDPPDEADCPYIILVPSEISKIEGEDQEEHSYLIPVAWAIKNEEYRMIIDDVHEAMGIGEANAFGQLIFETLAGISEDNPITRIEQAIEPVMFFPQIVGTVACELVITPTIGGELVYP